MLPLQTNAASVSWDETPGAPACSQPTPKCRKTQPGPAATLLDPWPAKDAEQFSETTALRLWGGLLRRYSPLMQMGSLQDQRVRDEHLK